MGTLSADFLEGLNAIYEAASVSAVFEDRDSKESKCNAIINYNLSIYGDVAEVSGLTAAISVRKSELVYPPRRGEAYTIDGTVYVVDSILTEDELEHTALVK